MPPLPSVANILRCQLQWSDAADNDVTSTLYFRYTGSGPSGSVCNALAADIYAPVSDLHILFDAQTQLIGVKLTDLTSATAGAGEHAQSTTGNRGGESLAAATCTLVNFTVDRRYRGGKPRNYFPWGVATDLTTRQSWSGEYVTLVDENLSSTLATIIGTTESGTTITTHVNVSYYDGFTVETSPSTGRARNVPKLRSSPVVDNITSFATATRVSSQRRRNGR